MNIHDVFEFLSLALLLVVLGIISLVLRRRASIPKSAPRGTWITRTVETLILLSAGLLIFVYIGCLSSDGLLLKLKHLRPEYAKTHIIIAASALAAILLAALLSLLGSTSWAVVLAIVTIFSYEAVIRGSGGFHFRGLIARIAPKDSYAPRVYYNIKANIEGVELWINNVYLGRTPFTITADEFHQKVPFLAEPPDGYSTEHKNLPAANWFRMKFSVWEPEAAAHGSVRYSHDFKDYYARLKYKDEWGQNGLGICGGSGVPWRLEYNVSLQAKFPSVVPVRDTAERRLDHLIEKARLSDYKVEAAWFVTMATHGRNAWRKLRSLATEEKALDQLADEWVEWKYGISNDVEQNKAREVFRRICNDVKNGAAYESGTAEALAVEMIFHHLDLEQLVDWYETSIKKGSDAAPRAVVAHAIRLWDRKVDAECPGKSNIIEQRIAPAVFAYWDDPETAAAFGSLSVEKFLLRHYQRERRVSGIELAFEDRKYHWGLHLNKWLYVLARLDSPAGKSFRKRYRRQVLELADLLMASGHNSSKDPPEFLFLDPDQGKNSMAYQYRPNYMVAVETSHLWDYQKLAKKWAYLARLEPPATFDMYMDCWRQLTDIDELMGADKLVGAVDAIAKDMRVRVATAIIEDLEKRHPHKHGYVRALKSHLASLGDEESIQWLLSELESEEQARQREQVLKILNSEKGRDNPLVKVLASHNNLKLRLIVMGALRNYPTKEHRDILRGLLEDRDEQVRTAAEKVADELKTIQDTPLAELVSYPDTKGVRQ